LTILTLTLTRTASLGQPNILPLFYICPFPISIVFQDESSTMVILAYCQCMDNSYILSILNVYHILDQ